MIKEVKKDRKSTLKSFIKSKKEELKDSLIAIYEDCNGSDLQIVEVNAQLELLSLIEKICIERERW